MWRHSTDHIVAVSTYGYPAQQQHLVVVQEIWFLLKLGYLIRTRAAREACSRTQHSVLVARAAWFIPYSAAVIDRITALIPMEICCCVCPCWVCDALCGTLWSSTLQKESHFGTNWGPKVSG